MRVFIAQQLENNRLMTPEKTSCVPAKSMPAEQQIEEKLKQAKQFSSKQSTNSGIVLPTPTSQNACSQVILQKIVVSPTVYFDFLFLNLIFL